MNCRKVVSAVFLLLVSVCMQAQGTCVIEGKVKNVKQGVCLNLFRMEGDVGNSIAQIPFRETVFVLKYLSLKQIQNV